MVGQLKESPQEVGPRKESQPTASKHIQTIALTAQTELDTVPDSPSNSKVLCGACHGLFRQPVELACKHYACAKCLQTSVQSSGSLTCPTCASTHSLAVASVRAPPPLLLDLLVEQLTLCDKCKEPVKTGKPDAHKSSDCLKHTTITVHHILKKPLTTDSSDIEEKLGPTLLRRKIKTGDGNSITISTGGPVGPFYDHIIQGSLLLCHSAFSSFFDVKCNKQHLHIENLLLGRTLHIIIVYKYQSYQQSMSLLRVTWPRTEECSSHTLRRHIQELRQHREAIGSSAPTGNKENGKRRSAEPA